MEGRAEPREAAGAFIRWRGRTWAGVPSAEITAVTGPAVARGSRRIRQVGPGDQRDGAGDARALAGTSGLELTDEWARLVSGGNSGASDRAER